MGLGFSALSLAGMGLSALTGAAGIYGARQQQKELNRQAEALQVQADNDNKRSQDAFRQGEEQARLRSQRLAQVQGANRANAAGQGLLVGEGGGDTQQDIWETNANAAAGDIEAIVNNAKIQQDQLDISAADKRTQANALRLQGEEATRGAWTSALVKLGLSAASWGLGEWGGSVYRGGMDTYLKGLETGDDAMRASGLDSLYNASLIRSGGSMLAGLGGGRMGQSIYESGQRSSNATWRLENLTGALGKRNENALLKAFGGY